LSALLSQAQAIEVLIERIPKVIKSFEEAFHDLEPRQQKGPIADNLKGCPYL
jgi:hypothetical protein